MKYTKNDLKAFKNRGIKKEDIDKQMQNFKEGFDFVELAAPATLDDGIKAFDEIERSFLIELYEQASAYYSEHQKSRHFQSRIYLGRN
ncbi:hypothetical protein FACS1894195_5530 [Bacteroidia bacterium]|nr:hypothetical protein FACS1894195_5530 [Bacteroidia bacterium]